MSVLDQFSLDGETAVVTGGARGLGEEMAIALTEAGANVAIADVTIDAAESTATVLEKTGSTTTAVEVDVTDETQVQAMVETVVDRLGPIEILINNAGIAANARAEEMEYETWQRIIDVNLSGVFLCAKHVGRQMLNRGTGRIINIASMSAYDVNVPQPQVGYNASKAGVLMVTKSMAVEWADRGVRVNAIAPGYMRTDLVEDVLEADPEMEQMWLENTPMGRLGRPEDLAGLVVYLASTASSYMTGEIVRIDGGYTAR
ncbi:SDR family NAD(P)-dependent oxidoreductase [Halocatena marina]|uniref:SDR family NAD(P)-dependent oxidoreductase n=1 Tax=Halocatena marina TaxID=2934937 RepID=UPI00200C41CD|nr:glucose 1-dehydrogenase [Halocatena marina]